MVFPSFYKIHSLIKGVSVAFPFAVRIFCCSLNAKSFWLPLRKSVVASVVSCCRRLKICRSHPPAAAFPAEQLADKGKQQEVKVGSAAGTCCIGLYIV